MKRNMDGRMMKITALLTGKGSSTLKNKNLLDVMGHPVMYYPASEARKSVLINSFYCSSDSRRILDEAEKIGYTPILRPNYLSRANTQHVDVIKHAIKTIGIENVGDILIVLLANNVAVKREWIDECIEMLRADRSLSSVVPIYEDNDHHPLRGKVIDKNGCLRMAVEEYAADVSTNRQELNKCYFLAHNFWVINTKK